MSINNNSATEIVLLGSGNVATHIGKALIKKGFVVKQVYSKTLVNAKLLADELQCTATNQPKKISKAPVYLICLKDDVVHEVLNKINFNKALLISTSGVLPLNIFKAYSSNVAVMYPLQTFSKHKKVKLKEVPFLIEATNKTCLNKVNTIAEQLSKHVQPINSKQRNYLHLAAVFACNFSNHLYFIAEQICKEHHLDFNLLKPLIVQTAKKINDLSPSKAQTGPAQRNDFSTIENHLELLKVNADLQSLYKVFTNRII